LQDNWVKAMQPLASFISVAGDQAVDVVQALEGGSKKVGPYAFKVMEPFTVPDDYLKVATIMKDGSKKATPQRLRMVAGAVLRDRYWSWLLLHPGLGEDRIHPSRSVSPMPSLPPSIPPYFCIAFSRPVLLLCVPFPCCLAV
jgi:hypothetical protein